MPDSKSSPTKKSDDKSQHDAPVIRETIESFAVALVLAFLFRAFVAEAFVIPTGSMAPTLMGAHKDVRCPECGCDYQCGASSEFDNRRGGYSDKVVVATTCPLCRYELPMDLKNKPNHATFNGDRILVSKFAYMAKEPSRWDVIVFKYPMESRQNYIKRLVGRPNENLHVRHGDIYVQPKGSPAPPTIARKPPRVIEAVLQPLHDTSRVAASLVQAGVPSSFQPFPAEGSIASSWKVDRNDKEWKATCNAIDDPSRPQWLRYYHQVINPRIWSKIKSTGKLPAEMPLNQGRLITDFSHYNATISTDASNVYESNSRGFFGASLAREYRSGENPRESKTLRAYPDAEGEYDGIHWVGDLAAEFEVEIQKGQGSLILDLVEMGIHHQCRINTETGEAKIVAMKDDRPVDAFEDGNGGFVREAMAKTKIQGAGRYRIKFANVDDQLVLWVGGEIKEFAPSSRFASERYVTPTERRPRWTAADPLDGAPVGMGVSGLQVTVHRARVWRDIYYTAAPPEDWRLRDFENIDLALQRAVKEPTVREYVKSIDPRQEVPAYGDASERIARNRDAFYSLPSVWAYSGLFAERRELEFPLDENQYFPMGDNSRASFDARGWPQHFVPERLLIGRAVLVFWPHAWNRPIPMLPNVRRMGLIR